MSKKGPQHKGKAGAKPSASTVPETSSLDALLTSLFEQSEARLVKADQRSKKDVVNKVVSGLVPIARSIVADPRSEGLQKHAVKAVLAVNSNCALGSALSKKVVSIFFTVLVDELHSNWKEYGFKESEVNPDYHIEFESYSKKDGVTYYWDAPDIDGADYEHWERAWNFLQ